MRHAVEPTGRADEWLWQIRRLSDGVVVGFYRSRERAGAAAEGLAADAERRAA